MHDGVDIEVIARDDLCIRVVAKLGEVSLELLPELSRQQVGERQKRRLVQELASARAH